MNEHTSIVVYRNPMEQYLWESGLGYAIILGIVAAGITVFVVNWLCETYNRRYTNRWNRLSDAQAKLIIASGIATMIATICFFS